MTGSPVFFVMPSMVFGMADTVIAIHGSGDGPNDDKSDRSSKDHRAKQQKRTQSRRNRLHQRLKFQRNQCSCQTFCQQPVKGFAGIMRLNEAGRIELAFDGFVNRSRLRGCLLR
ncbi:hypothetical protein [Azomonas macrocytogenes]|uniref:Uncharacterized protein n=1 Tax=Azomonas macrocytogenes TaxID=69962 RepID=A0A839SXU5_AZOMA|nr:hypothetical protein [Azomonas macrocytogenes]MBB3101738.1 hypothetical protein [Azomonas macrocytogenes]